MDRSPVPRRHQLPTYQKQALDLYCTVSYLVGSFCNQKITMHGTVNKHKQTPNKQTRDVATTTKPEFWKKNTISWFGALCLQCLHVQMLTSIEIIAEIMHDGDDDEKCSMQMPKYI